MRRILLIDDDELLAAPLAAYLRRFDLELQATLLPSEGLAKAWRCWPAVVLRR